MCVKSQYCSYSHLSATLERSGTDWLIAMFEVYFDDSGTDSESEIAVAACYISTKRGWDDFVKQWNDARWEEGFDTFHMAEFVAPRKYGHKPFCDWDNAKKTHVYRRLTRIINENKRIGIAAAVPKSSYDKAVPAHFRERYGKQHYTYAVRTCLTRIAEWRTRSGISIPMRYVFDWEMQGSEKRQEISAIWDKMLKHWEPVFGMEVDGYSFEKRDKFIPLQAADILAWQMRSAMRHILPSGKEDLSQTHGGFKMLRQNQEMDLEFYAEADLEAWVKGMEEFKARKGFYP